MVGRSRVSGTGLGLWIARELVAAGRGRLTAANRAGGGSVFTIVVPTLADRDEHEHARESQDAASNLDE